MARLIDIRNKVICGGDNSPNTGKLGCTLEFGQPEHLIRMPRNFKIPKETDFGLTYINQQIQLGKFTPIMGASAFELVAAEDSYNTNSSGVKRNNLEALPEYRLMYEEGHEFYKEMADLKAYKSFDYIIGDDQGNWRLAIDSNGDYKGFAVGHTTPEIRKDKQKGGDNEMKALLLQFTSRREWDKYYDIFPAERLDFASEEIGGVNGVNLYFDTLPTTGATKVQIKAVLSSDNNTLVEGLLTDGDFLIKVAGANADILGTGEETTPGHYDVTFETALQLSEVVEVSLGNAALNVNVVLNEGILYRGGPVTEQVIAP